jgi:hypothetical protein
MRLREFLPLFLLAAACSSNTSTPSTPTGGDAAADAVTPTDGAITPEPDEADVTDDATAETGNCGPAVSFKSDVAPLFAAQPGGCSGGGCHGGAPFDLSSADAAHKALVGPKSRCQDKLFVVPGDVAASYLVQKLEGTHPSGCGMQMPMGGTWDAAKINTVKAWICQGARND